VLLIDPPGLVDGPLGSGLNDHLVLAAHVDHAVAIQRGAEVEALLTLLEGSARSVLRLQPVPEAREHSPAERRQEHFPPTLRGTRRYANPLTLRQPWVPSIWPTS
jgi:hypothetical protein